MTSLIERKSGPLFVDDLEQIYQGVKHNLTMIDGKRLFITGGTGFFGTWIVEALCYIKEKTKINLELTLLSRNPDPFIAKMQHLNEIRNIRFVKGNILDFSNIPGKFDYVIHSATDSVVTSESKKPIQNFLEISQGTRNILEFAKNKNISKMLYVSSGAVYGIQTSRGQISKEGAFHGFPHFQSDHHAAHAMGKQAAEFFCKSYFIENGLPIVIARCFSFVGPHLPLNAHFAIGNFIYRALNGKNIELKTLGQSVRSYMYAGDLAEWLLTILLDGKPGEAYNVGSDRTITLRSLAEIVGETLNVGVRLPDKNPEKDYRPFYFPNITKSKKIGLKIRNSLTKALLKTIAWHREN